MAILGQITDPSWTSWVFDSGQQMPGRDKVYQPVCLPASTICDLSTLQVQRQCLHFHSSGVFAQSIYFSSPRALSKHFECLPALGIHIILWQEAHI